VLAGEFFARLALGLRAVRMRAMGLQCVELEFVPMRANKNDWLRGASASGLR
jgi:hypothetical protein